MRERVSVHAASVHRSLIVAGVASLQDGRNVDISNSLEIVYSVAADGGFEVDEAFLTKKMDQCAAFCCMRDQSKHNCIDQPSS